MPLTISGTQIGKVDGPGKNAAGIPPWLSEHCLRPGCNALCQVSTCTVFGQVRTASGQVLTPPFRPIIYVVSVRWTNPPRAIFGFVFVAVAI